jgi:hypothetical protein
MTIPIQRVFNQVLGQLNANASNYGGASEKPEYRDNEVMDVMLAEEANIYTAIGRAEKHGRRKNLAGLTLVSEVNVANGGELPSRIGPILEVEIDGLFGTPLELDAVRELVNKNVLNLKLNQGYWAVNDNFLWFTGTGPAKVTFFNYTRPTFPNLAAFLAADSKLEAEFETVWVDLTVGRVMPREGAYVQAADAYYKRGLAMLATLLGEQVAK